MYRWTVIFAPRKNMRRQKPPKLPDTFFGWVIPLIRISQEQMIDKVGLDAVIVNKRMIVNIVNNIKRKKYKNSNINKFYFFLP